MRIAKGQWLDFLHLNFESHPGWLVWDYRDAAKVLELGSFRDTRWWDAPVALAPKGDAMVMVRNGVAMVWELSVK